VADPETKLSDIVFWLLGSFGSATWQNLALISICTGVAAAVLLGMRWRINVLSLGDEEARTLGVHPARDRLVLLAATCLAISAQVAVSGIGNVLREGQGTARDDAYCGEVCTVTSLPVIEIVVSRYRMRPCRRRMRQLLRAGAVKAIEGNGQHQVPERW